MKQGEVWLVKLKKSKSVGHEYFNDRPVLIIMSNKLISAVSVVTIMPLSSQLGYNEDGIIIKRTRNNKLSFDSVLKVSHIMSYDKSRFIHKIGAVDVDILNRVEKYLKKHFDII